MTHDPRIVLLDIETLPNVVTSWGLKISSGYLDHANILQERTILCAAWKALGDRRVEAASILSHAAKKGEAEDAGLVRTLRGVLDGADCVVAHNGDGFDIPWIMTRIIGLGLTPPRPFQTIDTKKLCRSKFYFNSNRLDYVGKYLGVGQKIKTDFDLWKRCMSGMPPAVRKRALSEMVRYNREDVALLERVYLKLRPFVTPKVNRAIHAVDDSTCPTCGSEKLEQRGFAYTRTTASKRFVCRDCGAWSSRPCGSRVVR